MAIYLPKNRLELVMTPRNTVRITVHHCIIEILLKMALIPTKQGLGHMTIDSFGVINCGLFSEEFITVATNLH